MQIDHVTWSRWCSFQRNCPCSNTRLRRLNQKKHLKTIWSHCLLHMNTRKCAIQKKNLPVNNIRMNSWKKKHVNRLCLVYMRFICSTNIDIYYTQYKNWNHIFMPHAHFNGLIIQLSASALIKKREEKYFQSRWIEPKTFVVNVASEAYFVLQFPLFFNKKHIIYQMYWSGF